jgi:hypothetical protein
MKNQNLLYEKLKLSLKEEILYEYSPKWLGRQRFDIFIPKYNIAIEYNGKQHYIPIKYFGGEIEFKVIIERDNSKRQKCIDNNCTLFEIRYDYNENDYNEVVLQINSIIKNFKLLKNEG